MGQRGLTENKINFYVFLQEQEVNDVQEVEQEVNEVQEVDQEAVEVTTEQGIVESQVNLVI